VIHGPLRFLEAVWKWVEENGPWALAGFIVGGAFGVYALGHPELFGAAATTTTAGTYHAPTQHEMEQGLAWMIFVVAFWGGLGALVGSAIGDAVGSSKKG